MYSTFDSFAEHERRVADSLQAYERRARVASRKKSEPHAHRGASRAFGSSLRTWLAL
nr:hypothetical protein [Rhodococcus sp. (in: high G+C Gram-positive bacteria)]